MRGLARIAKPVIVAEPAAASFGGSGREADVDVVTIQRKTMMSLTLECRAL